MHWLTEARLFLRSLWWTFWLIVLVIMIGALAYIAFKEKRD